jgi:hypothetical protein
MEASMHGSFDRPRKSDDRIHRSSGIGFFVLPALLVIALIGLAVTHPAVSTLVSDAVQAEFVGIDLVPDTTPTRLAQPGMVTRTVKAN